MKTVLQMKIQLTLFFLLMGIALAGPSVAKNLNPPQLQPQSSLILSDVVHLDEECSDSDGDGECDDPVEE